ncbi:hypothetical protein [Mesorhizobium sp. Cs1299R1N3]|uniref:hypothetical protein n=1 Tax=Mesorhizobium sp. Cs1299R1N3 TaxID=3015173 RepID=UPI00301D881F
MKQIMSLMVLAAIGAAIFVGLHWMDLNKRLPDTVQSILDENVPGNTLKVAFLKLPISAAIPYVGPTKSEGYFMVTHKTGVALTGQCEFETIDYSVRDAADNRFSVSIEGSELAKIYACQ